MFPFALAMVPAWSDLPAHRLAEAHAPRAAVMSCAHTVVPAFSDFRTHRLAAARARRAAVTCCAPESDERERARERANDEARRSEWGESGSGLVDEDLAMLKERIELQTTTEQQLGEIKEMLRAMQGS
eukprot:1699828-Prymnesium_polylepis.1